MKSTNTIVLLSILNHPISIHSTSNHLSVNIHFYCLNVHKINRDTFLIHAHTLSLSLSLHPVPSNTLSLGICNIQPQIQCLNKHTKSQQYFFSIKQSLSKAKTRQTKKQIKETNQKDRKQSIISVLNSTFKVQQFQTQKPRLLNGQAEKPLRRG